MLGCTMRDNGPWPRWGWRSSGPVKDRLRSYGLYDRLGDAHFFATLGTAIDAYVDTSGIDWVDWTDKESP
jgi:hypothetical protein